MYGKNILKQQFFARDSLIVARDLLGKIIALGEVGLMITETEAYRWPQDSASHSFRGKTLRNAPMFGPPGHAYVYLCYGLHNMLNFVTNSEGEGAAVLIRSCEPVFGHEIISERRGQVKNPLMLAGPGKVAMALGVDRRFNAHPLFKERDFCVYDAPHVNDVLVGPRIGIDYACPQDRKAPYRFAHAGSLYVSHRSSLQSLG